MSSSSVTQEFHTTLQLFWAKLQGLPKADTADIVCFSLMLLFVVVVLLIMFTACCQCCCCISRKRRRVTQIQPEV